MTMWITASRRPRRWLLTRLGTGLLLAVGISVGAAMFVLLLAEVLLWMT